MEPLLPATQALFADQQRQQQHFVQTAQIQKNLRDTTVRAISILDQLAQRGESLAQQGVRAEEIEASSTAIALEIARETQRRTWWGWFKQLWTSHCFCGGGAAADNTLIVVKKKRVLNFSSSATE